MEKTLGEKLSPILTEIETALLENYEWKPNFTEQGFISGAYIFQSLILDRMFDLQEKEDMDFKTRGDMATRCGEEIRMLIKKYCDIDSHDFYKEQV